MNSNVVIAVASRAVHTAVCTQVGAVALRLAPVTVKVPALAAVAAGGAVMAALDCLSDGVEGRTVYRADTRNKSAMQRLSAMFTVARLNINRNHDPMTLAMRTGNEAVLGSVLVGFAGVKGVLPVLFAFGAGAVGFAAVSAGFVLASAAVSWLVRPSPDRGA